MVVFRNRRLGPGAELLVSPDVAGVLLRSTAAEARPFARARWEVELVRWLEHLADVRTNELDVADIAWTPDHFQAQRRFLLDALDRAAVASEHLLVFERWRAMIEAHPADAVQVGRLWHWQPTA